ncbi:MAG: 30S ribosomal protein S24e [Euryarchaeota archaeon]|nr:30S ribosomal protein S24e [Euryarchaeota archaeon]
MKIDITSKIENNVLSRAEVYFKVDHDGDPTPSRNAVRDALASVLEVPKERIIIDEMDSKYGIGSTDGYAKVYDDVETARKFEKNYILVRNELAEKKPKKVKASVVKKSKR